MTEEKYKVGEYLYSMNWSFGADGTKVKKTKILKVTKLSVTIDNENWGPRAVNKARIDSAYFNSELECLKYELEENKNRIKSHNEAIKEYIKRDRAILKQVTKLKKKVK